MHRKEGKRRFARPKTLTVLVAALGMVAGLIVLAGPASATTPTGFSSSGVTFTAGTADHAIVNAVPNVAANSVTCEDVFFPIVDCFGHIFSTDYGITYASGVGPNSNKWEVFTDGSTPVGTYTTTLQACDLSSHCITETYTVTVVAAPSLVVNPSPMIFHAGSASNETATITSSVPNGSPVTITCPNCGANLPAGLTFTSFGDANPGTATIAGQAAASDAGPFTVKLRAVSDEGGVTVQNVTGYVYQTNAITPTSAPLQTGVNATTAIHGTGYPYLTSITCTDCGTNLPAGLTFTDLSNGTGTSNDNAQITGTPAVHAGGVYTIHLTLHNGVTADQTNVPFQITVKEAPSYTCGGCTFDAAATGFGYSIGTVYGYPLPAVSISGAPAGISVYTVTLSQDSESVVLHGSCTHCGGSYTVTLTASNSSGTITPTFTLNVWEAPFFTGATTADWTALHANTTTITTTGGYPSPALLSVSSLPSWATFTDNHDGTATITGTPPVSASGDNWIYITACNNNNTLCHYEWYDLFVQAPNAPMPYNAPTSDGLLSGVNIITTPGSTVNWSGSGYAPYAPVTLDIYNAQTYHKQFTVTTKTADANGNVTFHVIVPNTTGIKYVAAGGYKSNGTVQYLTGQTRFMY